MCNAESPVNGLFSGAIRGFRHRLGRDIEDGAWGLWAAATGTGAKFLHEIIGA